MSVGDGRSEVEQEIDRYLQVGQAVVFHADPLEPWGRRYRTCIRGWLKPVHIILDRPFADRRPVGLRARQPVIIRSVFNGEAFAFDSFVIDWELSLNNRAECRIEWPRAVEVLRLRKHSRSQVDIPCVIRLKDGSIHEGRLCDISLGGCAITSDADVRVTDELEADFRLPDGPGIREARLIIRNIRETEDSARVLGCEFYLDQHEVRQNIALFLQLTPAGVREEQSPANRVLIIDGDNEASIQLCEGFRARGCDALTVPATVDGLHRLWILRPTALLINQELNLLSGLQLAQFIRGTPTLESLPVFLYGCTETSVQREALQAGVARCFPNPLVLSDVCEAVDTLARAQS